MIKRNVKAVVDIETDLSHNTIWMAGVYLPHCGKSIACFNADDLAVALAGVDTIIGHNIIAFDLEVLERVWGFSWNRQRVDTLVLGRLLNPSIDGGHSLKAWAQRAGKAQKLGFDVADFDAGLTDEMVTYCLADCEANWDVYEYIMQQLQELRFSDESIALEHDVAAITAQQVRNGFAFDWPKACALYDQHLQQMQEIEHELQQVFPPIITERYSEKTGKRLKDSVETFNVGSRQQVAKRLEAKGAVWTRQTPTGKPVVDESSLKDNEHIPEAVLVLEYLTLQKRVGMLKSWVDAYQDDGRIHGRVNPCGAVTGRMTHSSPNMAQIPSGAAYRECFTVPPEHKLVGVDASALELRLLAHYMQDEAYIKEVLEGDIHTANQHAFGCATRDQAKTLYYAMAYGAGDEKLGSIVGKGRTAGTKLRNNFKNGLPAYAKLLDKVAAMAAKGTLLGLDGRRVHVRSEHAALNTLLQSAGAIIMKQALVIAVAKLDQYGYPYKLVAQVHDEMQLEVPEEYAVRVGVCVRNAIRDAGRHFNLRIPMEGEFKVGNNWSETH